MTKHDLTSLRKAAKSINGLTIGQITTLCDLIASGDLIHVDEVPGYVAKTRGDDAEFCFQLGDMVNRFLTWPLPEDFQPDGGITFEPVGNAGTAHEYKRQPSGTNLLNYEQAKAMVRHITSAFIADHPDTDRETIRKATGAE
ncbi:hypothetical protein [Sagittula sp. MA-2]|jgi:hypothetical protein|uniref:hypothetical protein n=1 Tax=Sagittula sp. MA-2 TaxID=3048007 RepID=UPI0024C3FC2C|nr:hypothetical protein [Sagittula sp. MA-2]WHZ35728.1 hypothetical protein QNI11_01690 [Sagittula sp. MA-2]